MSSMTFYRDIQNLSNISAINGQFSNLTTNDLTVTGNFNFSGVVKGLPSSLVVWRPGYVGDLPNVYSDFGDAVVALHKQGGQKTLQFDNSLIGTAMTIPQGTWDMNGVTWFVPTSDYNPAAPSPTQPIVIEIAEGVHFIDLVAFDGSMIINYRGSSPCVELTTISGVKSYGIYIIRFTVIRTNDGPFYELNGDGLVIFIMNLGGGLGTIQPIPPDATYTPVINITNISSIFILGLGESANLNPNCVAGAVGGFILPFVQFSAMGIQFPVILANYFPNLTFGFGVVQNNNSSPKTIKKALITTGITDIVRTAGIVTLTQSNIGELFLNGENVLVSGVADPSYDGTFGPITIVDNSTITYAQAAADAPNSNGGNVEQPAYSPSSSITDNQGIQVSDIWINMATSISYICTQASGSAIWKKCATGYSQLLDIGITPVTLLADELRNNYMITYSNPGAGVINLPNAFDVCGTVQFPQAVFGEVFELVIVNTNGFGSAFDATVSPATGSTIVGDAVILAGTSRSLKIIVTDIATPSIVCYM